MKVDGNWRDSEGLLCDEMRVVLWRSLREFDVEVRNGRAVIREGVEVK